MLGTLGAFEKFDQYTRSSGSVESAFPTIPKTAIVQRPERIFVQADVSNTNNIYIGKTGVQTDGSTGAFVLVPGSNSMLPFSAYLDLVHKTTGTQILYITYLAGGSQ
jgi:hypothetical protein